MSETMFLSHRMKYECISSHQQQCVGGKVTPKNIEFDQP